MTPNNQKPEANARTGVTAVGSGDLLGVISYDLRELIVRRRGGDISADLTALVNNPSDIDFEIKIAVMRAGRAFAGLNNCSLDWHSKSLCRRFYSFAFFSLLRVCLSPCYLLILLNSLLCRIQKSLNLFCNLWRNLIKPRNEK